MERSRPTASSMSLDKVMDWAPTTMLLHWFTGSSSFQALLCPMATAMAVGAVAPLLRCALFGMPPLFPTGAAMCFELAAYGLASGLLYARLPKRTRNIYLSLITAMLLGRVVWGGAMVVLLGMSGSVFTWAAFVSGAFAGAVPGIVLHILLIPVIVVALRKAGFVD